MRECKSDYCHYYRSGTGKSDYFKLKNEKKKKTKDCGRAAAFCFGEIERIYVSDAIGRNA